MKMRCQECGYAGEKINFMKLEAQGKALTYVDACPECGFRGPFEPYEEPEAPGHEQAAAMADRIYEEQRRAVSGSDVPDGTLLTDDELKDLDTESDPRQNFPQRGDLDEN